MHFTPGWIGPPSGAVHDSLDDGAPAATHPESTARSAAPSGAFGGGGITSGPVEPVFASTSS